MECCCHLLAGTPDYYLEMLDELHKRVCRTVGPTLATLLPLDPLGHRRKVASLSLQWVLLG